VNLELYTGRNLLILLRYKILVYIMKVIGRDYVN